MAVDASRPGAPEEPCLRHGDGYDTSPPKGCLTADENKARFCSSLSCAQEGCDDARIATTVEYSQDYEGFFIRCVRDQKIPYGMKAQGLGSQIGTAVAQLREGDEGANRFMDFLKNTVSGAGTVGSDEFPNFVYVCERVWMENKPAHERRRPGLFWRSRSKAASPSMG